jgi:hypothetical protein
MNEVIEAEEEEEEEGLLRGVRWGLPIGSTFTSCPKRSLTIEDGTDSFVPKRRFQTTLRRATTQTTE